MNFLVATPTKEVPLAFSKRDQVPKSPKLFIRPFMPAVVGWKGFEINWLKVPDNPYIHLSLSCKCVRFSEVVSSVANLLAHEASIVMSIIRLFGEFSVCDKVACPCQTRPA